MKKLPIYDAVIQDENEGIIAISLVDCPATEVDWVTFGKQENIKLAIANEEEHILAGVVMTADSPIYRVDELGREYYIRFTKDTIKYMAEKMLKDGTFNTIDIQHDGQILEKGKVTLVELFIKDSSKGINPNYLEVPDGSLLANYKIHDEKLWQAAKEGKINGFSLEGWFTSELNEFNKSNKMGIKEALKKLLAQFEKVETDKAVLLYDGEELTEGIEVTNENGDTVEDGIYTTDESIIEVKDGVISSIKPKEVEVEEVTEEEVKAEEAEVVEEPVEEVPAVDYQPQIDALIEKNTLLEEKIASLEEKLNEILTKPVAEPVEEEFSKVSAKKSSNKAVEYAKYVK